MSTSIMPFDIPEPDVRHKMNRRVGGLLTGPRYPVLAGAKSV